MVGEAEDAASAGGGASTRSSGTPVAANTVRRNTSSHRTLNEESRTSAEARPQAKPRQGVSRSGPWLAVLHNRMQSAR